jgi:glutathione S-transferase
MKLYGAGTSNVHRALLVLFEKEVWDVELVHVNLLAGEHMKPWYQAMQPFHQIPLLEDCDFRLYGEDMNHTPDQIVIVILSCCSAW